MLRHRGRAIAPHRLRGRQSDECLEDIHIEIREALEVEAGLAHLVLPEHGQEFRLPGIVHAEVHHEVSAPDGEGRERRLARVPAFISLGVGSKANDTRSPHVRFLPRHPLAHVQERPAVLHLLSVGSRREVLLDARAGGFGSWSWHGGSLVVMGNSRCRGMTSRSSHLLPQLCKAERRKQVGIIRMLSGDAFMRRH